MVENLSMKKKLHILILNGFSFPSFALSYISSTENLNHLFLGKWTSA